MTSEIKKYEFKPGLPMEFELTKLRDLYKNHKELMTSPHRTNFYHVLWFQKGITTHLVDFKQVDVKPGTILFLKKTLYIISALRGTLMAKPLCSRTAFSANRNGTLPIYETTHSSTTCFPYRK